MKVGIGSSLPAELFDRLTRFAGVDSGPMPVVGQRVAETTGLTWTDECDSRHTASGGGSTITLPGLHVLIEAVKELSDS
ncbi:hypothetical protein ACFU7D_01405 [Nocardioides sp. NPDC057577]|uniref:hypothetical protein n=1 Tax=Nocardioides sp. NPDC057577 TaxID=3346171 RepID=UPI00366A9E30